MVLPAVPNYHIQNLGIYAQDDWRANTKLSVNFGLRWDVQPPVYDTQNRLSEMSPTTPNPGAGLLPGAYIFAPQLHVRNFQPTYFDGWAPRLGLAYSILPDFVIRSSYGVLLSPPSYDGSNLDSTGFSGQKAVSSLDGGITPGLVWDQGWTNVVRPPSFDPSQQNGGTANISANTGDRWPVTNKRTLDHQKSLARDIVFTAR